MRWQITLEAATDTCAFGDRNRPLSLEEVVEMRADYCLGKRELLTKQLGIH
jgi:hypothetical protein